MVKAQPENELGSSFYAMTALIIDDEIQIRRLLKLALESRGYTVREAENGTLGLQAAVFHKPDVIILDLGLPDMDGVEVLKRLREWSPVPVLILSVRDQEAMKLAAFDAGADDYVTKPFSPRELVLRIKAILRRAAPADVGQRLTVGLLSLDTGSHRAWVGAEPLELTALEFKLLHHFMTRPGRVQSREQLLSDVWGITSPLETRTVDTHVMRLRDKLSAARESIETVRGVGYRMADAPARA